MQGPPHGRHADLNDSRLRQLLTQFHTGDVRLAQHPLANLLQHVGGDTRRRAPALFISGDPAGAPDLAK